jgi:ferredoxin--NADP+ reductase
LVTVGAQGTKWLGLPGEQLVRVYHAKDLVYHYNKLPPYANQSYPIGKRVAIIGAGNVMLDIAHWLVRDQQVESVTAVVRRGPADVKFTRKEMESVFANLDQADLNAEITRTAPIMQAVGQDPAAAAQFLLSAAHKAVPSTSHTRLNFRFLAAPSEILSDTEGGASGLRITETTLVADGKGGTTAQSTDASSVLAVDTVIFAIGDTVDVNLGLPVQRGSFIKRANPTYPVENLSYEADYGPGNIFLAGWAREASTGLVGVARKDGSNAAKAIGQYLQTLPDSGTPAGWPALLNGLPKHVDKAAWQLLEQIEQANATAAGLPIFKFDNNAAMLEALGLH